MSKFCFGIDLGTTNSCIAVMQGSGGKIVPRIIPLKSGSPTLPSCVMFDRGKVIVGKQAYQNRHLVEQVVYSSKRDIGTDKVYHINDGLTTFDVTPTDVAYYILKELKESAERYYGEGSVDEIVITVPAYFNYEKRKQTKLAAERAGMRVLGIINEPTAAALAYTYDSNENDKFLVYDLGGGTFDVTILQMLAGDEDAFSIFEDVDMQSRVAQVIASAGDDHLGGDDLDQSVFELACAAASKQAKKDLKDKSFNLVEYLSSEQREKMILSIEQHKRFDINSKLILSVPITYKGDKIKIDVTIGIDEFKQALEPLYLRTKAKIQECVEGAANTSFDKMVLVGGSTKLMILRDRIRQNFPNVEIYCGLNPDESVALGAAVQASIIKGQTDFKVNDVLPQSIGIDSVVLVDDMKLRGRYQKLITKDTSLPAEATIPVSTLKDNQESATVAVYQGEDSLTANNTYLGSIKLDKLPSRSAGSVDMRLTLRVDANGLVYVTLNAEGNVKELALQNILRPQAQTVSPMLRKMYASMESAINNADISEQEREDILDELDMLRSKAKPVPKEFQDKVRGFGAKTLDRLTEAATSHFASRDGYIQSAIVEEDDVENEPSIEE